MDVDRFLRGFDRPERVPPSHRDGAEPTIFDELDELKRQRGLRGDNRWSCSDATLKRLTVERLAEERRR